MQVGCVFSAVDRKQILECSRDQVEVVVDLFDQRREAFSIIVGCLMLRRVQQYRPRANRRRGGAGEFVLHKVVCETWWPARGPL
jgi:hypothetical protein